MKFHQFTLTELAQAFEVNITLGLVYWKNPTSFRVTIGSLAGTPMGQSSSRHAGRWRVRYRNVTIPRAHLIWLFAHEVWSIQELDHIDCNRSNDCLSNLRMATRAANARNVKPSKRNKSGVVGVSQTHAGTWVVQASINGKRYTRGGFKTVAEAASYKAALLCQY